MLPLLPPAEEYDLIPIYQSLTRMGMCYSNPQEAMCIYGVLGKVLDL